MPRKVRAPQGTVPGNAWAARADGKCNREQTAERSSDAWQGRNGAVRAHREPGNRPARHTPPGASPPRETTPVPAVSPGRLLERSGDATPRGMTVQDRTRLIGRRRHL